MESDGLRSVRNAFYLQLYADVAREVAQLDKSNRELQGPTQTHDTTATREEAEVARERRVQAVCLWLEAAVLTHSTPPVSVGQLQRSARFIWLEPLSHSTRPPFSPAPMPARVCRQSSNSRRTCRQRVSSTAGSRGQGGTAATVDCNSQVRRQLHSTPSIAHSDFCLLPPRSDDQKELVLDTLKDWLATPDLASDVTLQIIAAHIYLLHGQTKEALQLVANDAENLEK